jgi:LPS O-antigen subunit length determinant protein (WzzB/FepE family)
MEVDTEERGLSLLDLLIVAAKNLKLLIFGPIAVGLLALGFGYTLPQSFTSQAILSLATPTASAAVTAAQTTQAAALMVSPVVLDPVIESLKLYSGQPLQFARADLASQIKTTVGKDGLLRLEVTANKPSDAQGISNAVIDSWLKSSMPGEQERAELERRLIFANDSLKSVNALLGKLTKEGATALNKPLTFGEAGLGMVAVGELQARYQADVLTFSRSLKGFTRDTVVQPPTLPTHPVAPKKSVMAVLAALGSGVAFLLWVFLLQIWRDAARDPEVAKKQMHLLTSLGLGK